MTHRRYLRPRDGKLLAFFKKLDVICRIFVPVAEGFAVSLSGRTGDSRSDVAVISADTLITVVTLHCLRVCLQLRLSCLAKSAL